MFNGMHTHEVDRDIPRRIVWDHTTRRKRGRRQRETAAHDVRGSSDVVASAIRDVVDANHILFDQGVVDGSHNHRLRIVVLAGAPALSNTNVRGYGSRPPCAIAHQAGTTS